MVRYLPRYLFILQVQISEKLVSVVLDFNVFSFLILRARKYREGPQLYLVLHFPRSAFVLEQYLELI